GNVRGGKCPAKGEALYSATAEIPQEFSLGRRLDALGNYVDVQRLCDSDDGSHHGAIGFVFQHAGDEFTGDLDAIGTEPLHVGQRGVARAKIVDADADAA